MKLALMIIGGAVGIIAVLLFVVASIYNVRIDKSTDAKEFLEGHAPERPLDGDYRGNAFAGMGANWLGKHFQADSNTGINNFKAKTDSAPTEQHYPFTTSLEPSLRNKHQTVLQLNYDVSGNPMWLRLIRDEVVEVGPGRYLGKIHLKLGFYVVTIGHFRLEK